MSLQTQSYSVGDWLKGEAEVPQLYSREEVTLLAGSGDLKTGTVLGKITASGKYVPLDLDADDGSQTAAGILLLDVAVDASTDTAGVRIARQATIAAAGLTWPTGATAEEKAAALATLKTLGIIEKEAA